MFRLVLTVGRLTFAVDDNDADALRAENRTLIGCHGRLFLSEIEPL